MKIDLATISRVFITIAILMQLYTLTSSKKISSNAFFIYAIASYMMAYDYYIKDKKYTKRVIAKILNSTLLLLIAIFSR